MPVIVVLFVFWIGYAKGVTRDLPSVSISPVVYLGPESFKALVGVYLSAYLRTL